MVHYGVTPVGTKNLKQQVDAVLDWCTTEELFHGVIQLY